MYSCDCINHSRILLHNGDVILYIYRERESMGHDGDVIIIIMYIYIKFYDMTGELLSDDFRDHCEINAWSLSFLCRK